MATPRSALSPAAAPRLIAGDPQTVGAKEGAAEAAPDFTGIERLLPRLILFPALARKSGGAERRALDKCVRLCEDLLALRPEVERAVSLSAFLGESPASPGLNSLLALVQEGAGSPEKMGLAERALFDRRIELCHEFEGGIPRDLQEWIALWDRKIDEEVGADYLRWLSQGGTFLQKQVRDWAAATASFRPATFGIFARIRSLKWASRARKDARKVARIGRELELRKKRLEAARQRTASLCGVLAAFIKAPSLNAGVNTRIVRKLLVLEIERELGARLEADINERRERLCASRAVLQARAEKLRSLREYVAQLEARKNMRLVELCATSASNVREALPAATISQVNAAFAELDAAEGEWNGKVEGELARVHKLKREMERLAGVLDEYAERYFGSGVRSPAGAPVEGSSGIAEGARGPVVRTARLDGRS